jgi:hypothetical protein
MAEEIEAAAAGKARNIQGERTNRELRWRILRTSDAGNFRKRALADGASTSAIRPPIVALRNSASRCRRISC